MSIDPEAHRISAVRRATYQRQVSFAPLGHGPELGLVTGRADKRFCLTLAFTAYGRSPNEPCSP